MIFLALDDLLYVAERALGAPPEVRDHALLASALARPRASAFGSDAYPWLHEKAAALLHSLGRNHGLVDGNKRLALAAAIAFYGLNGGRLTVTNDEAYDLVMSLVMSVATGDVHDVPGIAAALRAGSR